MVTDNVLLSHVIVTDIPRPNGSLDKVTMSHVGCTRFSMKMSGSRGVGFGRNRRA